MNFYCNSFNLQKWFKTRSLSTDELVLHSMLILEKELECTIDKVLDNTITAFRKVSGFKIILRLDAINDYGYMIFNDKGKQLARFDSADHYDINYGPDHLHYDLKKKEEVISSFLSGIPEFDYKSILKVIQEYENKKPYSTIPSHK